MRHPLALALAALPLLTAAQPAPDSPLLDSLLHAIPLFRDTLALDRDAYEIQVLYRPLAGPDSGTTHTWGLAPDRYFYPASTVKLPVAALALERIAREGIVGLTSASAMEVGAGPAPQTASRERVGMPGTPSTVAGHVADIGIVSSNEAYNRLYEWLGPEYINRELHGRGLRSRIVHRLGEPAFGPAENTVLNPVAFRSADADRGDTVLFRGLAYAKTSYTLSLSGERKGRGRYDGERDEVFDGPFDFSAKNYLALADLAAILQAIVAPATVDSALRFRMLDTDRELLLAALSTRPADSDNPLHHEYPDGYVNFLYYGGDGDWEPDGPLIYNKVGDAYGTLTDAAVFADPASGRPLFLVAATIHVNANGVYNDGVYEYEELGLPFFRALGRGAWRMVWE